MARRSPNLHRLYISRFLQAYYAMASVSIVGGSGYGAETLDRVLRHPELQLHAVRSDSLAGRDAAALDPRLNRNGGQRVPRFITNDTALATGADVTFLCLPHEQAAAIEPPALASSSTSQAHTASSTQSCTTTGTASPATRGALAVVLCRLPRLGAPTGDTSSPAPGCYATATLLALWPLRDDVDPESVVVDAKSGMTGAGRSLAPNAHAGFVLENVSPYDVGEHRRARRIASRQLRSPSSLTCSPFAAAVATLRPLAGADLRVLLLEAYAESHLVTVLEGAGSGLARVQPHRRSGDRRLRRPADGPHGRDLRDRQPRQGAAGQAVQNVNALFGFAETAGLRLSGVLV